MVLNLAMWALAFPANTPKPISAAAGVIMGAPVPDANLTPRQQIVLNGLLVTLFVFVVGAHRLSAWKTYVIAYSELSGTDKIPAVNAICHCGYLVHPERLADLAWLATGDALRRFAASIPIVDDPESSIRFELEYTHLITTFEERYGAMPFMHRLSGVTIMPFIRLRYGQMGDRRRERLVNRVMRRADWRHLPTWAGTDVELRVLNRNSAGWRPSPRPHPNQASPAL
ncbi:hypothetical protein A5667_27495 [Mycolicibacterium fortuitum]|uniref:hypothetical protein n=1 Tax=Mycolicibacterium fortuitum TaxID=1766 RepID=UPI0007ED680A|nr:hypothetical protein [Mycolicibacterium fortuitum]OBI65135.1 hypothetical protein A5667_27495 [Mycolicibacterium fortuitum]